MLFHLTPIILCIGVLIPREEYALKYSLPSNSYADYTQSNVPFLPINPYSMNEFTITMWIMLSDTPGNIRMLSNQNNYALISFIDSTITQCGNDNTLTLVCASAQKAVIMPPKYWCLYTVKRNGINYNIFQNVQQLGAVTATVVPLHSQATFIAVPSDCTITAYIRNVRIWDTSNIATTSLFYSDECNYSNLECIRYYALDDPDNTHIDKSKYHNNIFYDSRSISQATVNFTIPWEGGYSDSTYAKATTNPNVPIKLKLDSILYDNSQYYKQYIDQSIEFWLRVDNYGSVSDFNSAFSFLTGYKIYPSDIKFECGFESRKISCYVRNENPSKDAMKVVLDTPYVESNIGRWAYISIMYLDYSNSDYIEMYEFFDDLQFETYFYTYGVVYNTFTSPFTTPLASNLAVYVKEFRLWNKRRTISDIVRTANNELKPADHAFLVYYDHMNEYRKQGSYWNYAYAQDIADYSSIPKTDTQDSENLRSMFSYQFAKDVNNLKICKVGYTYIRSLQKCYANVYGVPGFTPSSGFSYEMLNLEDFEFECWYYVHKLNNEKQALLTIYQPTSDPRELDLYIAYSDYHVEAQIYDNSSTSNIVYDPIVFSNIKLNQVGVWMYFTFLLHRSTGVFMARVDSVQQSGSLNFGSFTRNTPNRVTFMVPGTQIMQLPFYMFASHIKLWDTYIRYASAYREQ